MKKIFIDQMQREVVLEGIPKRIISLVPSQTEYLFDLGLESEVIGITKFCIYPEKWYSSKTRIGGTKNVDIQKIKNLSPDLIVGNKEENSEADIIALEKIAPVWMSDIYTLNDACQMMLSLGEIVDLKQKSIEITNKVQAKFSNYIPLLNDKKAIYLIWNNPLMAVGQNTFIHDMLLQFGLKNYYENTDRYPMCNPEEVQNVDYVLLSSEPFPFKEEHEVEIQKQFPKSKVVFVDGEMFSWYGSRLLEVPAYFEKLKSLFNIRL